MPEDSSLDAFASGDADASGPTDGEATDSEAGDGRGNAVDPAVPTYDWSPGGGECADCGSSVERRWRDGTDLVCGDCKSW